MSCEVRGATQLLPHRLFGGAQAGQLLLLLLSSCPRRGGGRRRRNVFGWLYQVAACAGGLGGQIEEGEVSQGVQGWLQVASQAVCRAC